MCVLKREEAFTKFWQPREVTAMGLKRWR